MNTYLIIVLAALVLEYFLSTLGTFLNLKALDPKLPSEFEGHCDAETYQKSQDYVRVNSRFGLLTGSISFVVTIAFILAGGFNTIDQWVRSFGLGSISSGLLFFGALFILMDILGTPASLYKTFVIEEKFGFNKMTLGTFLGDKFKSYILVSILGSLILGLILYLFEIAGDHAWLFAWGAMAGFTVILPPIFTSFIAPLFNKFTPIEDGELKEKLDAYAQKVGFPLTGIFVMDGSKRSTKSNAYFSGFGKRKRIALFDTLIEQQTTDELLAVLAHEIGHYKKKHIVLGTILSIAQSGILFFCMSFFLDNKDLFAAFKMEHLSLYAGLTFFSLLYSPIQMILSVFGSILSRKNEFEADEYSATTLDDSTHLISALKKLSVENLGNLTPHPFVVFLEYSHPPVLQRIERLREIGPNQSITS
ncbi:MAG: peptidase M48 [Myxococcales bacterium]|nr:peptidase M48 [Myxococcales bacterium]